MTNAHPIEERAAAVLAHREWIERLAARLVRDAARAEDLAQDTVAVALRKDPRVGVPLRSWLGTVLRNLYREGCRKSERAQARERTAARDASAADHSALLERADAHRVLVEHVLSLNEVHRVILLQRYFDGMSPTEIAAAEGRTISSVKSQLHRAHGALRARLESRGGEDSWILALGPLVPAPRKAWFTAPLAAAALVAGGGAVVAMGHGSSGDPATGPPNDLGAGPASLVADPNPDPIPNRAATFAAFGEPPIAAQPRVSAVSTSELHLFVLDETDERVPSASVRLSDAAGHTWTATSDDDGKILLADLPAGTDLTATILIGETIWAESAYEVRLKPAEVRRVSWGVHLTASVSGVAVDKMGVTLAEQWVQLTKTGGGKPIFENSSVEKRRFGIVQTNADGYFEFHSVPPGAYHIGAVGELPLNFRSKRLIDENGEPYTLVQRSPTGVNCPVLHAIVVPVNEPEVETEITIFRGHTLTGTIKTPGGDPAPDVTLYARMKGIGNRCTAKSDGNGRFSFNTVLEGDYTVTGQTVNEGWIFTGKVRTKSGATDLELEAVKTVDASGDVTRADGSPVDCWIYLVKDVGTSREAVSVLIQRRGSGRQPFKFNGLAPGRYRLIYFCNQGEVHGTTDFEVGPEGLPVTGLMLRADRQAQVKLINRWPGRKAYVAIYEGTDLVMESWAEVGETKLVAVPAGQLRAVIHDPTHGGERTVEFEAKLGEVSDVTYVE